MAETIARLGPTFELLPMEKSAFIRPASAMFELGGKKRRWDVIESHASVGVVIYHADMDAFIIVRQFRPPVYAAALRETIAAAAPAPHYSQGAHQSAHQWPAAVTRNISPKILP